MSQKAFLENYARQQRLTNIRHYIDDDESGRFFDRSAYSRMMEDVESGKVSVCIMKDLTRWGRDYLQVGNAMNNCIEGWRAFSNPRSFAKYGRQRGWERIPSPDNEPSATGSNLTDGFHELTEEEARQMELPF